MQPKLWREPRAEKPPRERLADRYERQNIVAAGIILANQQRYAGLPVEWSKLFMARRSSTLRNFSRRD